MAARTLFSSPAVALRCAFNIPACLPETRLATCRGAFRKTGFHQPFLQPQQSALSSSSHPPRSRPGPNTIPKDGEIADKVVQVVRDDGSLGELLSLRDALLSFDREQNCLIKVSEPTLDRAAVCKIISKGEYARRQQNKLKPNPSKSSPAAQTKQIELNWAIDQHDLSHRLKQMESFLDKGKKVHLLLTRRKRKRAASLDESKILLDTIQQRIKAIGAAQAKPIQGKLLDRVEIILQKSRGA